MEWAELIGELGARSPTRGTMASALAARRPRPARTVVVQSTTDMPRDVIGFTLAGPPTTRRPTSRRVRRPADPPVASVVACLFARPGSGAASAVVRDREYLDVRTGDTWDLFLPGYRDVPGARPRRWTFDAQRFDDARRDLERKVDGAWCYSGQADLLLFGALVPAVGPLVIDWSSCLSCTLDDHDLSIATIVEQISRDLEQQLLDPHFGVPDLFVAERSAPRVDWRLLALAAVVDLAVAAAAGAAFG